MLGTVANIFRIRDLRNKIIFTVALLIIYRVGFHIPVPGFDPVAIEQVAGARDTESPLGRAAEMMQMEDWIRAACLGLELCPTSHHRLF